MRTGATVERVTTTRVHLGGGEVIEAHTLIWAAGVRANTLALAIGVPSSTGGRVEVTRDLRILLLTVPVTLRGTGAY